MIARRVIERYFSCPNYYRIGGRPVFMIYDVDNRSQGWAALNRRAKHWTGSARKPSGLDIRGWSCN